MKRRETRCYRSDEAKGSMMLQKCWLVASSGPMEEVLPKKYINNIHPYTPCNNVHSIINPYFKPGTLLRLALSLMVLSTFA